jgi:hypothetical protein
MLAAARFVPRETLHVAPPARLIFIVEVAKDLPARVANVKALAALFDYPGRGETAWRGHAYASVGRFSSAPGCGDSTTTNSQAGHTKDRNSGFAAVASMGLRQFGQHRSMSILGMNSCQGKAGYER